MSRASTELVDYVWISSGYKKEATGVGLKAAPASYRLQDVVCWLYVWLYHMTRYITMFNGYLVNLASTTR